MGDKGKGAGNIELPDKGERQNSQSPLHKSLRENSEQQQQRRQQQGRKRQGEGQRKLEEEEAWFNCAYTASKDLARSAYSTARGPSPSPFFPPAAASFERGSTPGSQLSRSTLATSHLEYIVNTRCKFKLTLNARSRRARFPVRIGRGHPVSLAYLQRHTWQLDTGHSIRLSFLGITLTSQAPLALCDKSEELLAVQRAQSLRAQLLSKAGQQ